MRVGLSVDAWFVIRWLRYLVDAWSMHAIVKLFTILQGRNASSKDDKDVTNLNTTANTKRVLTLGADVLSVRVLTMGSWPPYKHVEVILPPEAFETEPETDTRNRYRTETDTKI